MDEFELHITNRRQPHTRAKAKPAQAAGNDKTDGNKTSTAANNDSRAYTPAYERAAERAATPASEVYPDTIDGDTENTENAAPQRRRTPRSDNNRDNDDATTRQDTDPEMSMPLIRNHKWRIFLGIACGIIGLGMLIMLASHMPHGAHDQSAVTSMSVEQMAATPGATDNATGSLGAWLSNALFTDALGLGSIVLAVYLLIIAAGFLWHKRIKFWSLTFKALLLSITISIVAGLVTFNAQTAISLGGTHGHEVNAYLLSIGGPIVAGALSLLLLAAVAAVYIDDIVRLTRKCAELKRRHRLAHADTKPSASETTDDRETATVQDEDTAHTEYEVAQEEHSVQQSTMDEGFNIDTDQSEEDTQHDGGFAIDAPQPDTLDDGKAIAGTSEAGVYSDHRSILSGYSFPTLDLLKDIPQRSSLDQDEVQRNNDRIVKALADKKITIESIKATVGPTVTLYEIVPSDGIRISQIKRLEDDIALSLAAEGIRIIAPMPGKGTVGIEVPNSDPQTVSIRSVLASKKFREYNKPLPIALGATISNDIFVADLASMPHVLVAGATGQGKSVGLNVIIASLLYKKHPTELKFVLIDPKEVEFSLYNKLEKHYLAKLPGEESAIVTDFEKVLMVLNSLCVEMDTRYGLLREAGVRDITEYNRKFESGQLNPDYGHHYMPYIVVIIDEFADLIMTAGKEIELPVTRITQKARAIGIHMVIATQRPSTNVLTGLIKSNCPARIAFRTFQMVDSRVILDRPGANQLIGRGDMLYSQSGEPVRVQCAFINTDEVENLVKHIFNQTGFTKAYELPEPKLSNDDRHNPGFAGAGTNDRDPLFEECARFIITQSTASTSILQRKFQIGYNRAGKIIDQMEACGIVGPANGNKPRQIKMDAMELENILSQR